MWFKRNDGELMCAEEDSPSGQMMAESPEFEPCDEDGNLLDSDSAEQSAVTERAAVTEPGQSKRRGKTKSK